MVWNFVKRPFQKDLWFLLILWLLSSAPAVWYYLQDKNLIECLDLAIRGLIVSYFAALFCCIFSLLVEEGRLRPVFRNIVYSLFLLLGIINLILDKGQYNICHEPFNYDSVGIIMGSNISESSEFIRTYCTDKVIIFIVAILVVSLAIYLCRNLLYRISKYTLWLFVAIMVAGTIFVSTNKLPYFQLSSRWDSVYLCKIHLFFTREKPVDLTKYRQDPTVVKDSVSLPSNVIVILGESVSASHCSINGYEKNTTPALVEYEKMDSLVSFSNARSASFHTIASFKLIFTENSEESDKWYESLTLFDVLKNGGYTTEWISNQSPSGYSDNITHSFAVLCDTTIFAGNTVLGLHKHDYDDVLLPPLQKELGSKEGNVCYFIHMMGCHEAFRSRYPVEKAKFFPSDYEGYPENQREYRAAYDNAILFGDSVIEQIFKLSSDKESVVIFFPDHGLDVYETDPSYCGHATGGRTGSIDAGTKIPFVIYCSTKFRQSFPEKYHWMESIKDDSINTKDFMPFLMKVCGLEIEK